MSLDALKRELLTIKRAASRDFREVIEQEIDPYLTRRVEQNFALQQEPDGTPWARSPNKGTTPTLVKTQQMKDAQMGTGGFAIRDITSDHIVRGGNTPWGPFQQYGVEKRGKRKKRKAKHGPPRPGTAAAKRLARITFFRAKRRRRRSKKFMGPRQMRLAARPYVGITADDADRMGAMAAEFIGDKIERAR